MESCVSKKMLASGGNTAYSCRAQCFVASAAKNSSFGISSPDFAWIILQTTAITVVIESRTGTWSNLEAALRYNLNSLCRPAARDLTCRLQMQLQKICTTRSVCEPEVYWQAKIPHVQRINRTSPKENSKHKTYFNQNRVHVISPTQFYPFGCAEFCSTVWVAEVSLFLEF